MPSRVGPRHAGQSVVEMGIGDAARADQARVRLAQEMTERIILFFIRLRADSLANTGKTGKQQRTTNSWRRTAMGRPRWKRERPDNKSGLFTHAALRTN